MTTPIEMPKVGKTVLETLTSGMYEDARFIYREYIQNSADQIDVAVEEEILSKRAEGKIEVNIDKQNGKISIRDNATGIKSNSVRRFLSDVANSEKERGKRKGFRGIGRLGGLGYCERLIFETSYSGEAIKSIMTLDAKLLKEVIDNRQDQSDASQVISIITKVETQPATANEHYFQVTLMGVHTEAILDESSVRKYLEMVAPVEFSKQFTFKEKIKEYYLSKNFVFDEYNVTLNDAPICKAYKDYLSTEKEERRAVITSIGFFDVRDDESQLLAIGWYGVSSRLNEMIDEMNIERGIRIRKHNITIGNAQTLVKRFKSSRTNFRYIGEVHVLGDGFIPNARRDYFNETKTVEQFEKGLETIFSGFEKELPYHASNLHNRKREIVQFRQLVDGYKRDREGFTTTTQRDQRLGEVTNALQLAQKANKTIARIKTEAGKNPQLEELFNSIIEQYNYNVSDDEIADLRGEHVIPPLTFAKVSKEQEQILNEVIVFLQQELGHKDAAPLISKLEKKYN